MLGQNQECYGACFSPEQALDGDLAAVRIWSRVLPQVRAQGGVPFLPAIHMVSGMEVSGAESSAPEKPGCRHAKRFLAGKLV